MDDDGSRSLSFEEFKKGVREHGLSFDPQTLQEMFRSLDKDGSGTIDFDEFLRALRVIFRFLGISGEFKSPSPMRTKGTAGTKFKEFTRIAKS